MKRLRWTFFLAVLLLVATVLPSCGYKVETVSSFEGVLNPDYEVRHEPWHEGKELEELRNFNLEFATDTFAVFRGDLMLNSWKTSRTYKVYSLLQNRVILTQSYDEPVWGDVDVREWADGIIRVATKEDGEGEDSFQSVVFYDLAGNELARRENQEWTPSPLYLGDYVVLDNVAYEADMETGVCTKVMEIPDSNMLRSSRTTELYQDYVYVGRTRVLSIYDKDLQWICDWSAPSYISSYSFSFYVLNDGGVLIQYAYGLEENAKKYDYYTTQNTETVKWRLVTLLMNPETGKTKELDFPYKIDYIRKSGEIDDGESSPYANSFENIAYLYPITDKQIDRSASAKDVVLLNNNGKIEKSLKLVAGQTAELPVKVGKNLYRVNMITGGCAIVTIDGEVVRTVNDANFAHDSNDVFCWTARAVYNLAFEKVYDLKKNHAEVVGEIVDSLLIKISSDDGKSYRILVLDENGEKEIYSYDSKSGVEDTFTVFPYLGYRLRNEDKTYTYYNVKGEALLTTYETLVVESTNNREYSHAVLYHAQKTKQYYVFAK